MNESNEKSLNTFAMPDTLVILFGVVFLVYLLSFCTSWKI